MRVAVLGGTRFIGLALVEDLVGAGHDVLVVHRGHDPDDLPAVEHVHVGRMELASARDELHAFRPDAFVDTCALSGAQVDATLDVVGDWRLVVLSSADVYRAFGSVNAGTVTDAVPLDETAPVRDVRYPYRGQIEGMDDYEKLDVEERYLARRGTVLRLPIVYGERDYQRREEPILRRVRAGAATVPIGAGTWLISRGYVRELARGMRLAVENGDTAGEVLNLCERRTETVERWWRQILDAAGSTATLERVPDAELPDDLEMGRAIAQPVLLSAEKAAALLGWEHAPSDGCVRASVDWHLAHPPAEQSADEPVAAGGSS